jgi:hypothetical protein
MKTFTDLDEAISHWREHGGYLLDCGPETHVRLGKHTLAVVERNTGRNIYVVCDENVMSYLREPADAAKLRSGVTNYNEFGLGLEG